MFKKINDLKTQTECTAERRVLKIINANCNSPISVVSKITNDQIQIKVQLLNHTGETIFFKNYNDSVKKYERLTDAIGNEIISEVGEKQIEQLNELENDFDYTP